MNFDYHDDGEPVFPKAEAEPQSQSEPKPEPKVSEAPPFRPNGPTFEGVDVADLEQYADDPVDWLVDGVLSADQLSVFAAGSKNCKTSMLVDLAVSLASGDRWLGSFEVPRRRKVLFITGESTPRAISRRLRRCCRAKGLEMKDLRGWLRVEALDFPKLTNLVHGDAVSKTIDLHEIEVVLYDPLYRGLLGLDPRQLGEVGDAIVSFAMACRPASFLMSHHITKQAARALGEPPTLEDMSGAGLAECCGNWWLMGRTVKYVPGSGIHDLVVDYGGRDEQGGFRRIVFDERDWTWDVQTLDGYRESKEDEKEKELARKADEKLSRGRRGILRAVANIKIPLSKSDIKIRSGLNGEMFPAPFGDLLRDGTLVQRQYKDARNRLQTGYMHKDHVGEFDEKQAVEKGTQEIVGQGGT